MQAYRVRQSESISDLRDKLGQLQVVWWCRSGVAAIIEPVGQAVWCRAPLTSNGFQVHQEVCPIPVSTRRLSSASLSHFQGPNSFSFFFPSSDGPVRLR